MNIFKIIDDIEKVDGEVYERLNSRRSVFNFLGKTAVAAIPFAFAETFKKAYGVTSTSQGVIDILNFALTLEYLESSFYTTGLNTSGLIPTADRTAFMQISKHETVHVATLKAAITSLGGTPGASPSFDFTAGGAFPTVFSDFATFTTLAQAFEDTGVRAYKGQAAGLISNGAVLTNALQIHSVEARHASFIRRLRAQKGWITGADGGNMPAATNSTYAGEDNTTQGTLAAGVFASNYTAAQVSEAFDEPLTKQAVLDIAVQFIVS